MTTREEHLAWCKRRALEYADRGDVPNAIVSMLSDLGKWEGGEMFSANSIALLGMAAALGCRTRDDVRRWVEGFN